MKLSLILLTMALVISSSNSMSTLTSNTNTIIIGLNGALQKRFILNNNELLIPGNVHRANNIQIGIGGKGQDVTITLSCLQYNGNTQLSQFIGIGTEGDQVYNMLNKLYNDNDNNNNNNENFMDLTVRPKNCMMRTCTSIIASDTTTELVEPSGTIKQEDIDELIERLNKVKNINNKIISPLCFMGSMPPGCTDSLYSDIYKTVASKDTLCVIDTVNGLESLINTIADMNVGKTIFKVNAFELCKLAKYNILSNSETSGVSMNDIILAIQQFIIQYPKSYNAFNALAITDGSHPAYLVQFNNNDNNNNNNNFESFDLYQIPIKSLINIDKNGNEITKVVNPIGAGDSVAAGLLAAWKCLNDNNNNNNNEVDNTNSCLPNDIDSLLKKRYNQIDSSLKIDNNNDDNNNINEMLTSFSFGLACGSASCLEVENSFLQINNVIDIYENSNIPKFLTTTTINQQKKETIA